MLILLRILVKLRWVEQMRHWFPFLTFCIEFVAKFNKYLKHTHYCKDTEPLYLHCLLHYMWPNIQLSSISQGVHFTYFNIAKALIIHHSTYFGTKTMLDILQQMQLRRYYKYYTLIVQSFVCHRCYNWKCVLF